MSLMRMILFWQEIEKAVKDMLTEHWVTEISGWGPECGGYPIARSRFKMVGNRTDVCSREKMQMVLAALTANAVPVTLSFRSFLGITGGPCWDRLHCPPTQAEIELLKGCTCGANADTR